jgi:hypothetical protein
MRRSIVPVMIAALLGVTLLAPTASADGARFIAPLSHAQEVGEVNAPGAGGSSSFWLDGSTLQYRIDVRHLTGPAVMAHIHGPAGRHVNADISIWLCGTSGFPGPAGTPPCQATTNGRLVAGSTTATPEQIAMLQSGQAYVNVHTAAHLPGEVRGQILRVGGGPTSE